MEMECDELWVIQGSEAFEAVVERVLERSFGEFT